MHLLILVIFQLHNPLPPLSAQIKLLYEKKQRKKAISSENAVREEWVISVCLGDNDKSLGERFAWGHKQN